MHLSDKIKKMIVFVCIFLLLAAVSVGATIALLLDVDGPVENTFQPASIATQIKEDIQEGKNQNVSIQNNGNIDIWIRATVVVTWQDEDGNIYGRAPEPGTDYKITMGNGWLIGADGFYYWPFRVDVGNGTGALISEYSYIANAPEGYNLVVDVVSSGLQASPSYAVEQSWTNSLVQIKVDGGNVLQVINHTVSE